MEALIIARLKERLGDFKQIIQADSLTPADAGRWPAAYVYTLAERAEHAPTRTGERQLITQHIGIQVADTRARIEASRLAVKRALIGWQPRTEADAAPIDPPIVDALYFDSAKLLQLSEQSALWLDVFAVNRLLIIE